jgi:hypothetical protein
MNKLLMSLCLAIMVASFGGIPATAHDACADLCKKCSSMCSNNLSDFQKKGGKYADAARLNLMRDCIKICQTNADFKARDSANGAAVDKACADICHKCAKECQALNDPNLKDCIALCNQCADVCDKESK